MIALQPRLLRPPREQAYTQAERNEQQDRHSHEARQAAFIEMREVRRQALARDAPRGRLLEVLVEFVVHGRRRAGGGFAGTHPGRRWDATGVYGILGGWVPDGDRSVVDGTGNGLSGMRNGGATFVFSFPFLGFQFKREVWTLSLWKGRLGRSLGYSIGR